MRLAVIVLCAIYHVASAAGKASTLLLNDGNEIPVIALGTGRGTAKEHETVEDVRHAVFWAIEAGYRHIDTAALYEDEAEVGRGIAEAIEKGLVNREELFITTKLWSDKHGRHQVVPALKESLSRLGLDYVNLYLIHFPSALSDGKPVDIDYLETWQGMEEAKQLGLTRSIGVSNFNSSQIDRVVANGKIKPVINQIEVNPTLTQEPLVSHCHELSIAVMAYSPFGFLVSRKDTQSQARMDGPALVNIANKYGKKPTQIVLRYLVDRNLIAIPKSTNKERIAENIDIFDFKLTDSEIATINNFNQNIRVIDVFGWKDYPYFPFERN